LDSITQDIKSLLAGRSDIGAVVVATDVKLE
jgi:hypothetical protein